MTNFDAKLLIIWHSRTGASEAMAKAAFDGADGRAILVPAEVVTPKYILDAGAYLFVCPENLASMSGAMKEMFDRNYYPALGQIAGRPFATIIAAGSDGEGAQRQIDRIAKGWRLKRVAEPLLVNFNAQSPESILAPKTVDAPYLTQCEEVGAAISEGLSLGVF